MTVRSLAQASAFSLPAGPELYESHCELQHPFQYLPLFCLCPLLRRKSLVIHACFLTVIPRFLFVSRGITLSRLHIPADIYKPHIYLRNRLQSTKQRQPHQGGALLFPRSE